MLKNKLKKLSKNQSTDNNFEIIHDSQASSIIGGCGILENCSQFTGSCDNLKKCGTFKETQVTLSAE